MVWKKLRVSAISITLAVSILATSVSIVAAANILKEPSQVDNTTSMYDKISISEVVNEGGNPDEIQSSASAIGKEKEWYEYVQYSTKSVGAYNISENSRAVFYDPYDYSNALLMDIQDTLDGSSDWSSANTVTVSYTTGSSMMTGLNDSTTTNTAIQVQDGVDETYGYSEGYSKSNTKSISHSKSSAFSSTNTEQDSSTTSHEHVVGVTGEYSNELKNETSVGAEVSAEVKAGWGPVSGSLSAGISAENKDTATSNWKVTATDTNTWSTVNNVTRTNSSSYSSSESSSSSSSDTTGQQTTSSVAFSKIADRITSTTGSSLSNLKSWSTMDSKSVTKTYNATYFNANGAPLQWKVVGYTVYMPLYYEVQYKVDDEWTTVGSAYCLLVTIQGTCRSWIENNTVYYEHWGTGEPVTDVEFWDTFFTPTSLMEAYKNKLYPDR